MITTAEIIKEINDTISPFEFKLNIISINQDFIESISEDYILAVNKKISEIAKVFKKYGISISIDCESNLRRVSELYCWYDNYKFKKQININQLEKEINLNIDYYLLQQCINFIVHNDKSIQVLQYISY